jgi:hypothetical protein
MVIGAQRNMAFGVVNAYVVVVHNEHAPTDEEWAEYVQLNGSLGTDHGVTTHYLIVTDGGSPSAAQRKVLFDVIGPILKKHPTVMRCAVITSSTFTRGIVSAMHIIHPSLRAFSPADLGSAYTYLGIPPAYVREIEALIASLKARLR